MCLKQRDNAIQKQLELLALMGNVKCHRAIKQIINIIECVECDVASVSSRKRIAEIA